MPVFAEFRGGLGVLLGPTGGYLLSYPIAAAVAGLAARREERIAPSGAASPASSGVRGARRDLRRRGVWLSVVTDLPLAVAVAQGVLIFVPFDLIKVALAALVAVAAAPVAPSRV